MEIINLTSSFTSLFPFMILENLGSISSVFYHLHRNEFTYKLVYISRHIDFLILGYKLKGTLEYMELLFNFLSIIIIYKATVRDKKYMDINILIGIIALNKVRYEKLWNTFEALIANGVISNKNVEGLKND